MNGTMWKLKSHAALFLALLSIGSTAHARSKPLPPIPTIHRIAFVPPTEPRSLTFENGAPLVGYPGQFWVNRAENRRNSDRLNGAIDAGRLGLAETITTVVIQRLGELGFEVQVLKGVRGTADDPDNIDEDNIAATVDADAVVHVKIDEVGMYSGHLSTKYLPRVNIRGKLWTKLREDSLYSDEVDYGVDARKGKAWAIFPDERYRWGSFEGMMLDIDDVRTAFMTGARLAAMKMADQIAEAAASSGSESSGPARSAAGK
jgi:hypothetical protein